MINRKCNGENEIGCQKLSCFKVLNDSNFWKSSSCKKLELIWEVPLLKSNSSEKVDAVQK